MSAYQWAREGLPSDARTRKTLEAEIMDWADDIVFSVHDLEDFAKAGLIPLYLIFCDERYRNRIVQDRLYPHLQRRGGQRWETEDGVYYVLDRLTRDFMQAHELGLTVFPVDYSYTAEMDRFYQALVDWLIRRFELSTSLRWIESDRPHIELHKPTRVVDETELLKALCWVFVIDTPRTATEQFGKARVIRDLFEIYMTVLSAGDGRWLEIFPKRFREQVRPHRFRLEADTSIQVRYVADVISSLSDHEALTLHRRLTGKDSGSPANMPA